ncbi:FAD:protein FMN transferase [Thalassotalea atypica]|uniref:FAD:protein FMN transferase n=1 Tax=Thalassotalea atypica TaxID=2054316 RepID=UPI002573E114|nr:FAD:protein FMN transferase [Thalassotalea atypica]
MNSLTRCKPLLGTFVEVSIGCNCPDKLLVDYSQRAFNEISRIHGLLGFHDENSELSALNRFLLTANNTFMTISDDLVTVLDLAFSLSEKTNGRYDVAIAPYLVQANNLPNHLNLSDKIHGNSADIQLCGNNIRSTKPACIDLGGIAKGYAVDCAIRALPNGLDVTINAGGDIYKRYWKEAKVAIKYAKKLSALKTVKMQNAAVATSGDYEANLHRHIVDPLDGTPVSICGSVSVFAHSAMIADALTKVVTLVAPKVSTTILNSYQAKAVKLNRLGYRKLR